MLRKGTWLRISSRHEIVVSLAFEASFYSKKDMSVKWVWAFSMTWAMLKTSSDCSNARLHLGPERMILVA